MNVGGDSNGLTPGAGSEPDGDDGQIPNARVAFVLVGALLPVVAHLSVAEVALLVLVPLVLALVEVLVLGSDPQIVQHPDSNEGQSNADGGARDNHSHAGDHEVRDHDS